MVRRSGILFKNPLRSRFCKNINITNMLIFIYIFIYIYIIYIIVKEILNGISERIIKEWKRFRIKICSIFSKFKFSINKKLT